MRGAAPRLACLIAAALVTLACGKKGPPVAPLRLVPAPVSDVTARRLEEQVVLRFVLPTRNANGPGPVDLGRIDVYAITVPPGAPTVPDRELFSESHRVGEIDVPAPVEEPEAPTPAAEDTPPSPGEAVTFVDALIGPALVPVPVEAQPAAARPAQTPARGPAAARTETASAEATAVPAIPVMPGLPTPPPGIAMGTSAALAAQPARIYVIRGVTRGGRPGAPSPRLEIPLVPPPPPPGGITVRHTEKAVILEWQGPPPEMGVASPTYNVYSDPSALEPAHPAPLTAAKYEGPIGEFGVERCFRVRTVWRAGTVPIEGHPSPPVCITPRDTFPPAAPTGLGLVAADGAINLRWNANIEPDLAGYLVLRAEAPDDTLRALTPAPIRETSYRDDSIKPGVRYVYAIVAVDNAKPPNASPESARESETAR
jgi:hypothetical protein